MEKFIREPINSLTHFAGAVVSIFALIAMLMKAYQTGGTALTYTAATIFGISLILLYSASSLYHGVKAHEKVIYFLRKFDHAMIYVLIAGTYAPFCLITLKGATGFTLFSIVTTIAIAGVIFKLVWFHCPRWLSTFLYIGMGSLAIFVISPLSQNLPANGITLLVAGGILYTIGGLIYGFKPRSLDFKHFGHHEIFHIFILLGSLAHFLCIFLYVL